MTMSTMIVLDATGTLVARRRVSKCSCNRKLFNLLPTNIVRISTMSAKSLGTLPVIYAVDEQRNPIPRKTMLCGGDTNSTLGENVVFPSSFGLRLSIPHCITGEGGSPLLFLQ